MLFIRLVASPTLSPNTCDALDRRLNGEAKLFGCVSDDDVRATFISLKVEDEELRATVALLAESIGAAQAVGRAFRLELQHFEAAQALSDETLRSVAVAVHGALRAPVHVARRTVPASRWATARPIGWGAEGLVLGDSAPALPFGGSESTGVALEAGGPTLIAKAELVGGLSASQMRPIAAACGSAESGLVEVGAYPIAVRRDGAAVFVLECSDVKRTPLHRALSVLEIEGRRFGARLGLGRLLSDAPLDVFLDALSMHMGIIVTRGQVIETHLTGAVASRSQI